MSNEHTTLDFLFKKELKHRGLIQHEASKAVVKAVGDAITAVFEEAIEVLVAGGSVGLPGIGALRSKVLGPRMVAVNFKHVGEGVRMKVPSRRVLRIDVDEKLKRDLRAGKAKKPKKVSIAEFRRKMANGE